MLIGRIVGNVVADQKDEKLIGTKLMVVRQLDLEGKETGSYVVAADSVGAGPGEVVLYASGSSARQTYATEGKPIDATIMAIIDTWDVEGVTKYIERGMSGPAAAIRAMKDLFGPIIGITLVLMSVFLPAAFVPGLTGQMFAQFALVIAVTALISAFNAATLKPTQCALWLRTPVPPEQRNFFYRGFNRVYDRMETAYAALIGRMVRRSGLMVIIGLCVSGFAGSVGP